MKTRILWGLSTLPLAAIIALLALILRGPLGEVIPFADATLWAQNVTTSPYLNAQRLYIVSYALPLFGLWAMYAYLATYKQTEKWAFWGLMTGIFGTALALPTLGALSYAGPGFAQLYLQGAQAAPQHLLNIAMTDSMALGIPAAIFYSASSILFGIAILKARTLPRLLAYILMPHGAFLSFGFGFYPLIFLAWLSFLIVGSWLICIVKKGL